MIQSPRLKIQSPEWNAKARYRVTNTVIYAGNYWANVTGINSEPISGSDNWLLLGSVSPTTGGVNNNRNKYILVSADSDGIQDADFKDATQVYMIVSSVAGPVMKSDITFNSTLGKIEDFPVVAGEEFTVFFTKP